MIMSSKKTVFIALISIFLFPLLTVHAQEKDSLSLDKLLQMVETLQKNQEHLLKLRTQRVKDSLAIVSLQDSLQNSSTKINDLGTNISRYQTSLEAQEAVIKDVTRRVEITDEARYRLIKSNLEISVELFELLNDKLNTLHAISQVQSYRTMLAALNNPADESLGFSYSKKVMELMSKKITIKKDKGRVLEIAETFIKDPTIQGITSAVPILNMSSSLFSFVASLATSKKEISASQLLEFKKELDKYTAYYVKMNLANTNFIGNLGSYQVQTTNLHNKLEEFVVRSLLASGVEIKSREESEAETAGEYLSTVVFRAYDERFVQKYLKSLEEENTSGGKINYAKLLEKHPELTILNRRINEVTYFYNEFDYLYGQYISMLEENSRELVFILEEAKSKGLSDKPDKITKQIARLKTKKKEAIRGIKTAINIIKIRDVVERLNAYGI
jgi:cell division protein FtsL